MTKSSFFTLLRPVITAGLVLSYVFAATGCSEDAAVQDVINQIPGQKAFLADHPGAESASGTWDWDENTKTLTVAIENSQFECEFVSGESLKFKVSDLNATTMIFTVIDDDESEPITWTRVGSGTELEGNWTTVDGDVTYFLSLQGDGTAAFTLDGFDCDRNETASGYEVNGCWVDFIPTATVATDGTLDEWSSALKREDPAGDATQTGNGTDLIAMHVIANDSTIGLRLDFADSITQGIQIEGANFAVYEVTLRGLDGQAGIQINYQEEWSLGGHNGEIAVADENTMEISLPWANINGRTQLTELSVNVSNCSDGPCTIVDEGPCIAEPGDTGSGDGGYDNQDSNRGE